jgi:AraC-like DNA-binding protein
MYRRWRVRHSYPRPVVELVELLMSQHPVPELSRMLDLPMSVIYRWRARKFGKPGSESQRANGATLAALLAQCDQLGFRFSERISAVEKPEWLAKQVAKRGFDEEVSSCASPARLDADGADPLTRTSAPAVASMDQRESDDAHCRTGSIERARSGADVRRRRTSRGVTHRLEAARRLIDTAYFSDIDSRVLADAAQMSRHHFIRMFSGAFGISPHRYLTRTRIGAAKRLLLSSREPIEVIAVGVGFRSGPSLNRAFKQVEGASVSQFCKTINRNAFAAPSALPVVAAAANHVLREE